MNEYGRGRSSASAPGVRTASPATRATRATQGSRVAVAVMSAAALLCLSWTPARAQARPDLSAPRPIEPLRGSLVLAGGGAIPDAVWQRFRQLAGGDTARIVVIPTAAASADGMLPDVALGPYRDKIRPASITILHTRSRDVANSADFVRPLSAATGVWFADGDPLRLTAAYLGTRTGAELHALLARGGVIGGASGGAAVMTNVMVAETGVMTSDTVATAGAGFGFLPGAVVDRHVVGQGAPRLARVLETHPGLVGFGIADNTALVVHDGRQLEVLGESDVIALQAANAWQAMAVSHLTRHSPRARPDASVGAVADSGAPARTRMPANRPAYQADLIALSRAAQARARPRFPLLAPPDPVVRRGSLVIVGGGGMPEGLWARFIALAGGPGAKIVVVPTANGVADGDTAAPSEVRALERAGAKNVRVFHTMSRDRANADETLLGTLRDAGGVWFVGGRQWRLVDSYQNTTAHQLFLDVLDRGGVIGGTSAGASIQGDYMARGDPLGPEEIMAPGYESGLGFLQGVIIDQHVTQRGRQPDMTDAMRAYPQLLGIGLDEQTAIVVQGSVAEVVGPGNVAIYDRRSVTGSVKDGGKDYVNLTAGARFDLRARRLVPGG